jgi:hypothetical protein
MVNQSGGEVDAGRADRDLDLPRSRRNPVAGNEFQVSRSPGCADLQTHPVALMVRHGYQRGPELLGKLYVQPIHQTLGVASRPGALPTSHPESTAHPCPIAQLLAAAAACILHRSRSS